MNSRCTNYRDPTVPEYCNIPGRLARDAKEHKPKIIAGDFNARVTEWVSRETNQTGRILLEIFASLSIALANVGNARLRRRSYLRKQLAGRWDVSEEYSHIDQQAIYIKVDKRPRTINSNLKIPERKRSHDEDLFLEVLRWNSEHTRTAVDKASQFS